MHSFLLRLAFALATSVALAGCAPEAAIEVREATLRAPLPGSSTAVGYFVIENRSAAPLALVGATSTVAQRVEMHTHRMSDGMMRMRKVDSVAVPPGESVRFQTGGLHLMLFDVAELDHQATVTMELSDGRTLSVPFAVTKGPQ